MRWGGTASSRTCASPLGVYRCVQVVGVQTRLTRPHWPPLISEKVASPAAVYRCASGECTDAPHSTPLASAHQ